MRNIAGIVVMTVMVTTILGAQKLPCAYSEGQVILLYDEMIDASAWNTLLEANGKTVLCMYVTNTNGSIFSKPIRTVIVVAFTNDEPAATDEPAAPMNKIMLKDSLLVYQEVQPFFSKRWKQSPYFDLRELKVPATQFEYSQIPLVVDDLSRSIMRQSADRPNASFSVSPGGF